MEEVSGDIPKEEKIHKLTRLLKSYGSAVIAYSGGTDSTLLTYLVKQALGVNHLAVTATSPTYTGEELKNAKAIAMRFGFNHAMVTTDELDDPQFAANPLDRCYHCKQHLFKIIGAMALQKGIKTILDGTNADDAHDFRPGRKAAQEWGVISPFAEAGLNKAEIRRLAKAKGLPNWNKPANACLASRIPFGTKIDPETLAKIEKGELFLAKLGIKKCRVRHHGDIARIEVPPRDFNKVVTRKAEIVKGISEAGYKFITLDLAGYQMGCFNPKR
ncbi:MAG: ATP-dependent sacrificial sulfur transferase LarE [Candidatus Edwardsbacteria bacterium]|nr:ATP-dependent sacrificial sulfur transferase LarE [Candidatus Edwardsbacteria bacterium]